MRASCLAEAREAYKGEGGVLLAHSCSISSDESGVGGSLCHHCRRLHNPCQDRYVPAAAVDTAAGGVPENVSVKTPSSDAGCIPGVGLP